MSVRRVWFGLTNLKWSGIYMTYLDQIRTILLEEVSNLTDEQCNLKQDPASWSIAQVLEHLFLTEQLIGLRIQQSIKENILTNESDKPIHLARDRSHKVQAPEQIIPKEDFYSKEELFYKLSQSRQQTHAFLEDLGEEKLQKLSFTHPRFGALNLKQYIEFIGYHEERHLEQIRELKKNLGLE